jgi:glycosyltransferase involved in cell wall biosynthesis
MRWLMLRGDTPKDRDWMECAHGSIEYDDDVWVQLLYQLSGGNGVVWWRGRNHTSLYGHSFSVQFSDRIPEGDFDVVFCRGGFPWQDKFVKQFPKAIKIYYGAGKRFLPATDTAYDLVIVDSKRQYDIASKKYYTITWNKPCAENIFLKNAVQYQPEYDVCYVANSQQRAIKGIEWVCATIPDRFTMLHLGFNDPLFTSKVVSTRLKREQLPSFYSRCRVGIVPYFGGVDSAPRVIPEMLASGLPVVVADNIDISDELKECPYVIVSDQFQFWGNVQNLIAMKPDKNKIVSWYLQNSSVKIASRTILEAISL